MIHELDELLRQLLTTQLPSYNGGVNITFHQPVQEWADKEQKPMLNLFLRDIRENHILRRPDYDLHRKENGQAVLQQAPARLDLHYMVTAWAREPEDEHRLLADFLNIFLQYPKLTIEKLEKLQLQLKTEKAVDLNIPDSIRRQPEPIPMRLARHDELNNPAEIWGVLENVLRPAISCVLTIALVPFEEHDRTPVRTRDLRFKQGLKPTPNGKDEATIQALEKQGKIERLWMIGGKVHSQSAFKKATLTVVERGLSVPVVLTNQQKDEPVKEGRFKVGNLAAGTYQLRVQADDREAVSQTITIPNDRHDERDVTYDIEI